MIKPGMKFISFAFVALAAAAPSLAEQGSLLHVGTLPLSVGAACPAPARAEAAVEIERGWEAQQALLDERLAAKGVVEIPGTIISLPFPRMATGQGDLSAKTSAPLSVSASPR